MPSLAALARQSDPLAAAAMLIAAIAVGAVAGATVATSAKVGIMVIGLAGLALVWLIRPTLTIDAAIFLSCATLPVALEAGKDIGPVTILPYEILLILGIVVLRRTAVMTFGEVVPGVLFGTAILVFAWLGVQAGNDVVRIVHEAQNMLEMVAGFIVAVLVVRAGYSQSAVRTIGFVLWFSAGMVVLTSLGVINAALRIDNLQEETGVTGANRVLTATQIPSMAVVCWLVLGMLIGRVRWVHWLGLGLPALLIQLLAFTRTSLIVLGVAMVVTVAATRTPAVVKRTGATIVGAAAVVFGLIPGLIALLNGTAAGKWLSEEVDAYTVRVFGGISSNALAVDTSTLARVQENENLMVAFKQSPLMGHGLGFAYQLPSGKLTDFSATALGMTYAHNFHLLFLVKAGVVGMCAFALFTLTPIITALRSTSEVARSAAALGVGLLAACFVDPLPIESPSSLVLGATLGVALGFARRPRAASAAGTGPAGPITSAESPIAVHR